MEDPHASGQAAAGAPDPDPPWGGNRLPDGNPDPGPPGPLNPPPGVQPPYEDKKGKGKRKRSEADDLDEGDIRETAAKTTNTGIFWIREQIPVRDHWPAGSSQSEHLSTASPNQSGKSWTDRRHEYMPSPGLEETVAYRSWLRNIGRENPRRGRGIYKYELLDHQNREIEERVSAMESRRICRDPSRRDAIRTPQYYRPEPGRNKGFDRRASPYPPPPPPRDRPPQFYFAPEPARTNGSSRSWNAINVPRISLPHRPASSPVSMQLDASRRAILSPTPETSSPRHQNDCESSHSSDQNTLSAYTPMSVNSNLFTSDGTTLDSNPLTSPEGSASNGVGRTEDGREGKRMRRSNRLTKNHHLRETNPPPNRRRPKQNGLGVSTNRAHVSIGSLLIDKQHRVENRGDGQVTRMGAGESYRPTARPRSPRSPPRADTFRANRDGSPRRERARTPISDSYHPRNPSPRRRSRSRSPSYRRDRSRDNSYRGRPRSPPRARSPPRRFSPRREDDRRERPRSPRRDERRRSRSPYDRDRFVPRARSPLPRRSPPTGPRGSYRRSRSPDRRDDRAPTGPSSASWRRRSPSPAARDSERSSGRTSGDTSRRSSPHVHPSRLHLTQAATSETGTRSPPTRDRSPHSQPAYRDRDSARSTPRERSPVRPVARSPPRGPAAFRAAPTGPSSSRNFTAPSPVQPSSASVSMSAHNRPENVGPVVPPAGPRGYNPSARGSSYMRGGRGSFSADRQARPDTTAWGPAPPSRPAAEPKPVSRPTPSPSPSVASGPSAAPIPTGPSIPTGPRAGTGIPSRPSLQHSSSVYGPRPTQPSTVSGPRPHPAMANLAQIIPGGRIDPTASGIPGDVAARLNRKEEEAEVLRQDLESKRDKLRQNLKTWDKLSRESASMALKTELSERHVRMLAGEGVGGAAF